MSGSAAAIQALDDLEKVRADLAGLTARTDDRRRHDLVRYRSELAIQITRVGQAAEPLFPDRPDDRAEFRRLFSAMRSAAALHQAEWPAVRLGEFDDQYRRSTLGVRAANRAFVEWLRARLAG